MPDACPRTARRCFVVTPLRIAGLWSGVTPSSPSTCKHEKPRWGRCRGVAGEATRANHDDFRHPAWVIAQLAEAHHVSP